MSLNFIEGPAGSGKTTRLMLDLSRCLETRPLNKDERVLALTRMHGSRRRMQDRLLSIPALRRRFECVTVDSFAWRILCRWKTLSRIRFGPETQADDYQEICRRVGALLSDPIIGHWISKSFPIIVIDEMQDSQDGQLEIIRRLSENSICLAAADYFQDLNDVGINAAVTWARQTGHVTLLTQIHRTSVLGILNAANALREGRAVPPNGSGFHILGARNHNVGASFLSKNLSWWRNSNDIAVISPVGIGTSHFIRNCIQRVESGPIGTPQFGPHRVPWELSHEGELNQFYSDITLPDSPTEEVAGEELPLPGNSGLSSDLKDWFKRQRKLIGRLVFTVAEIRTQVQLIHQRRRAHRQTQSRGVRAMTIHQAKNREFESVIILWPYEVQGTPDRQRRLLYNAITRAKRQVLVIVQSPSRISQPPFT